MALQFKPPFEINQGKTKEEALAETIGPTIQNIPLLYLQYKNARDKMAREDLTARREAGYKNVQQRLELLKLGRGQVVFNPETQQQAVFSGVTGYKIDFDKDGVPDLVKEDGTVELSTGGETTVGGTAVPPGAPASPGVAGVKLAPPTRDSFADKEQAKLAAKIAAEKPKATGSFNNALREFDNMIKEAEAIRNDPSLGAATGYLAGRVKLPGGSTRVASRLETLKAKTLLTVLTSIKELSKNGASGFGQLNETEGKAIRDSISTLAREQDTSDFVASLDRFIEEMNAKKQNLSDTFTSTYGGMPVAGASSGLEYSDAEKERRYQEWKAKQAKP